MFKQLDIIAVIGADGVGKTTFLENNRFMFCGDKIALVPKRDTIRVYKEPYVEAISPDIDAMQYIVNRARLLRKLSVDLENGEIEYTLDSAVVNFDRFVPCTFAYQLFPFNLAQYMEIAKESIQPYIRRFGVVFVDNEYAERRLIARGEAVPDITRVNENYFRAVQYLQPHRFAILELGEFNEILAYNTVDIQQIMQ